MIGKTHLVFFLLSIAISSIGQGRKQVSFNNDWSFTKGNPTKNSDWSSVQIPHTWNAEDPFDDDRGYYRGVGWYKKEFEYQHNDREVILHFEAVNQVAQVYVNDQLAGSHIGGYTAFSVNITTHLQNDKNEIRIKVDNSHNPDIIPLKGDFNFYGGIYRDIWWIEVPATHFHFSEFGDKGVFVSTPEVSNDGALVHIQGAIKSDNKKRIELRANLIDPRGNEVANRTKKIRLTSGVNEFAVDLPEIQRPELWSPDSPRLYALTLTLMEGEKVLDQEETPVGLRWFEFTADEGFFLNGEHMKLMGTNRHQDYENFGNALSDRRHRRDMQLIKAMGSNFFRTAHYPQDPAILDACDELGLLVTMEIPLDHDITDDPVFYANSSRMMQEMIRQYYNHPSIIIWAYMNEMLLGRNAQRDSVKIRQIVNYAQQLEDLTRKEDPTRYTMIPNHGALELYHNAGLTKIPMLVGWNLYYGWYEATLGAGSFLDEYHQLIPDKPMLITEYGAGSDPRIRSLDPVRFDFSIDWQNKYHQANIKDIIARSFVAGSAIWNFADFGSEGRNDAVPRVNSKGVMTMDRIPKDSYYLYQSWLSDNPMVKIAGCDWSERFGMSGEINQDVQVYSSENEVTLLVNGESLGTKAAKEHVFNWTLPLQQGKNSVEATLVSEVGKLTDRCTFNYTRVDSAWLSENTLYLNCGTNFYFTDPVDQVTWLPDEMFQKSDLITISGARYQPRSQGIGSDRGINNTNLDPVYQTGRMNPVYTIKVPKGSYALVLHFAETDSKYRDTPREMQVLVNGLPLLKPELRDFASAYSYKTFIDHQNDILEIKVTGTSAMLQAFELKKQSP